MKKKIFAMAALLIILTGVVAGTAAYFTASREAHNVITSGNIDIELVETKLEGNKEVPYPKESAGLVPGVAASKIVRVHNMGEHPAWVRVKVEVKVNNEKVDPTAEDSVLEIDFNDTKWQAKDGYYYYTTPLAANDESKAGWYTQTPLFTQVKLKETADSDYENAGISISVTAEGIQYENNKDFATAWPKDLPILPLD